jgi:hypothetical protein
MARPDLPRAPMARHLSPPGERYGVGIAHPVPYGLHSRPHRSIPQLHTMFGENASQVCCVPLRVGQYQGQVELSRRGDDTIPDKLDTHVAIESICGQIRDECIVINIGIFEQAHLGADSALKMQVSYVQREDPVFRDGSCGVGKIVRLVTEAHLRGTEVGKDSEAHVDVIEERVFVRFPGNRKAVFCADRGEPLQGIDRSFVAVRRDIRRWQATCKNLYCLRTEQRSISKYPYGFSLRTETVLTGVMQYRIASDYRKLDPDGVGRLPERVHGTFCFARKVILPHFHRAKTGTGYRFEEIHQLEMRTPFRHPSIWFERNRIEKEAGHGVTFQNVSESSDS